MSVEEKFDSAKDQVVGKVKEVEGKLTGDKVREAEGKAQGVLGKVKDAVSKKQPMTTKPIAKKKLINKFKKAQQAV